MSNSRADHRIRAVVFDAYDTLLTLELTYVSLAAALHTRGLPVSSAVLERLFLDPHNGQVHPAHEGSSGGYQRWERSARSQGLGRALAEIDSLGRPGKRMRKRANAVYGEWVANSPWVGFPDALDTLTALRDRGFHIGICSNWGPDLASILGTADVNLSNVIDTTVSSAMVGSRKPHPGIYLETVRRMGNAVGRPLALAEVAFVGDSFENDVVGPLRLGFGHAFHLARPHRSAQSRLHTPGLPSIAPFNGRATRIATLSALLDVLNLPAPVPPTVPAMREVTFSR